MSHSHDNPEMRECHENPSYQEIAEWIASQGSDFIGKLNMLVRGSKSKAINLKREEVQASVEFLIRYLHHLHEQGELDLFEEVCKERFSAPAVKKDSSPAVPSASVAVTMPSAENFTECYVQFIASPDLPAITRLIMALSQFKQASEQTGADFPTKLSSLRTNLDALGEAMQKAEEERQRLEQNHSSLDGEKQDITDLENELKIAEKKHHDAIEFLVDLRGRIDKTEITATEDNVKRIWTEIEDLNAKINKAKEKFGQNRSSLEKEKQNITDSKSRLREAEKKHKAAIKFSADLRRRKKIGKTKISTAENDVKGIETEIEKLNRKIKKSEEKLGQNRSSLEEERKMIVDLEIELEKAQRTHRAAIDLLTKLRGKMGGKEISAAESDVERTKIEVENLDRKIKNTKAQFKKDKDKVNSAVQGTPAKQKYEQILQTIRQDQAELQKELTDFRAAVAAKTKATEDARKATEKLIPVPIDSASVVYLCIEHSHSKQGKSGDALAFASAEDFAELAVNSTSVDFDDLPPADDGFMAEYKAKLSRLTATQILKKTANGVLGEFPFLKGISVTSSPDEIEHHLSGEPKISIQQIVALIEYLRIEATSEREKTTGGIGLQDLTALEYFVRNLEHIVAQRLAEEIIEGNPTKPWERAAKMVSLKLYTPISETDSNPAAIKKHLQRLPKRGEHDEDGHGGHKPREGIDAAIEATVRIIKYIGNVIKKITEERAGSGTTPPAVNTAPEHPSEHH